MTDSPAPRSGTLSDDEIDRLLQGIAEGFRSQLRAPVLHTPDEVGLDFEEVTFPSSDGLPLEGWFIPAPGADRVVVANHPSGFSRSGLPAHLEPWRSRWESSGNGTEVDFVPDYRILHDAGYHVLAYDLRNHGLSGAGNGGIGTSGVFEARDVVGSLRYVRSRPDTRALQIGLFSRCLGANATFAAMTQFPEAFAQVRGLVAVQPLTTRVIIEHQLALAGVPQQRIDDGLMADLSRRMVLTTSIGLPRRTPVRWARNVTVPAYLLQVHDDVLTDPSDVQAMFDAVPGDRKQLHWVRGTTRRWDGYLEFQRRPGPVLDWLSTTMVTAAEPHGA
jgi:pimeloyl-ACP methyl ester carboxylesterase